jgi:hypothetical protein
MQTQFNDRSARAYEFTHGRKPRGDGHWMFDVMFSDGSVPEQFATSGTYSKAKAAAMAHCRAKSGPCTAVVSVCT